MTHDRLNFLLLEYNSLETILSQYSHLASKDIITEHYNNNTLADMIQKYDSKLYNLMLEVHKPKRKRKVKK